MLTLRNGGATICSLVSVTLWHMSIRAGVIVAVPLHEVNAAVTFRQLRPRRTNLFRIYQMVRRALRLPDEWTYTVQRQRRFSCRSRKGICSWGAALYRTYR